MFNRPEITAEWSVHAQVTITPRSAANQQSPSAAGQERTPGGSENSSTGTHQSTEDGGNVRVTYSWHGHSDDADTTTHNLDTGYGFNRGNLTFTAVPPPKSQQMSDSGYTSEKPLAKPERPILPYDKRCRTTCSIVLASPTLASTIGRRSSSMRCPPSPTVDLLDWPRRAHTFTTHFCTELPERKVVLKEAASQTTPVGTGDEEDCDGKVDVRRRIRAYAKRRHETDSVLAARNSRAPARRLCRSPASKLLSSPPRSTNTSTTIPASTPIKINGQTTTPDNTNKTSDGASSGDSRKPRTVHIDVYCTGSEPEDEEEIVEDSSNSEENEETLSASSPQTVFESEQVRVRHKRMPGVTDLPKALLLRRQGPLAPSSSGYPSLASSSSTVARGISASTMSSLMNSGSRLGYDSTSWKDTTTSDMESLMNASSRTLSTAPSDSFEYEDSLDRERISALDKLLWIQEKTWKSPEYERRMLRSKLKSFGSEDSIDNEDDDETNSWVFSKTDEDSPCSIVNKQEQECAKAYGFRTKKDNVVKSVVDELKNVNLNENSSKIVADETNTNMLTKETPIASMDEATNIPINTKIGTTDAPTGTIKQDEFYHRLTIRPSGAVQLEDDSASLPSMKESSRSTSPFVNSLPGYITGHLERARRFGNVVGALRKPGHHVGPAKNPDCECEHCRRYFETFRNFGGGAMRGRAFSAGSNQLQRRFYWGKRMSSEEPADSPGPGFTDL